MSWRSNVFLAAAALVAAFSLSGCALPAYVYGYCADALLPTMGQIGGNGMATVDNQCRATFQARVQINMCLSRGVNTLQQAKKDAITQVSQKCGDYVLNVAAGGDSKKITPGLAASAVARYVQINRQSLMIRMQTTLNQKIAQIVSAHYNQRYAKRAVPNIIQSQCGFEILKRGSQSALSEPSNRAMQLCYASNRGNDYMAKMCSDNRMKSVMNRMKQLTTRFTKACGKAVLIAVCPKGSACGIQTSKADTTKTQGAVTNFLWSNYDQWIRNLKAQLMQAAGNSDYSRLYEAEPVPAWQGTGFLAMVSLMAVSGVGCAIVAVHSYRKRSTSDTTAPEDEDHDPERDMLLYCGPQE